MKKKILLISFLVSISFIFANQEDVIIKPGHLPAPEFIPGFYDHYSGNYLNAKQVGMGATGVSLSGGIEYSLKNPASFLERRISSYIEVNVKGSTKEMITYRSNNEVMPRKNLEAVERIPAGMIGLGANFFNNINLGFSYSLPQTIRYNLYDRWLPVGVYLDRFPEMTNHQITFTMNLHSFDFLEHLSLGLNLLQNYYSFNATRVEYTFDKVSFRQRIVRFQPGLLYRGENWSFGASYTTSATEDMEVGNIEIWHTYNTTIPAKTALGFSYFYNDILWALELEHDQYSKQHNQKVYYEEDDTSTRENAEEDYIVEKYSDRITIKVGGEKDFDTHTLRAGLIYMPGIYSGGFRLPSAHDKDPAFGDYPSGYMYGNVNNTDQMLLTVGATYYFEKVSVSGAIVKDFLGNVDTLQLIAGLEYYFGK